MSFPIPPKPQPESSDNELEILFEPDPIALYRQEQLMRAGFSDENAWLIATRPEVDLHRAVDMIHRGVDELLVLRILI